MSNLPDPYCIRAEDKILADALRAIGIKSELIFPEDDDLLANYANVQRQHRGHYYTCDECGAPLLVRIDPLYGYGVALKAREIIQNPCPRCSGAFTKAFIQFEGGPDSRLFEKLMGSQRIASKLRLRLAKSAGLIGLIARPRKIRDGAVHHHRAAVMSLLGLLLGLSEGARHNGYYPGRPYVKDFPEITPHLKGYVCSQKAAYCFRSGLTKLVFPSASENLRECVAAAMNTLSLVAKLQGAALVVGRFLRIEEQKGSGKRLLILADSQDVKLVVENDLWASLCQSFGEPKIPGNGHTMESLVIAIVTRDGEELRVKDAAWIRTNRYGILTLSDYEHATVEALISLGYKFFKPQQLHLRFGKEALLVDVLVFPNTGPFVLEVDPNSSNAEPRKQLRNSRLTKGDVPFHSYDPVRHSDLRYILPPDIGPWWPGAV
jgi:hypothetical protein